MGSFVRSSCSIKPASLLALFAILASTVVLSPAEVAADEGPAEVIDFDYGDYYFETPEGYRTTDTDGDGTDPWGCAAYTYPYSPTPFWEVEPERSSLGRDSAAITAQVEANIAHAEAQSSDCWYNEWERTLHAINYARTYSGLPPVKPWFSNEHAEAAVQAQVECACSLRHWGEISQEFNDEFPGVIGTELISLGSGWTGLYSSLSHRYHFLDPRVDYVSFAFSDGYFVMLTIRSDQRLPNYDHSGFLTWGDHYESLEERNWVVGPEVGTGVRKADTNLSYWSQARREAVVPVFTEEGVEYPDPPYIVPTPLTVDDSLNPVIHDPSTGPTVSWQAPEVDTTDYEEDVVQLINDMRRTLADDDVNWPELNPAPIQRYDLGGDRPDPRSVAGGELDTGSSFVQYTEEGALLAAFVPEWKRSEDFNVFNRELTPLGHARQTLEYNQNYRTILIPDLTHAEVSVECAVVDGVPNGSLRVLITGVVIADRYDFAPAPRGSDIEGWGSHGFEWNNVSQATEQRLADRYGTNWHRADSDVPGSTPCPMPPPPPEQPDENFPVLYCSGLEVTVDLARGQVPTEGDDVIRGTSGRDVVDALGGNDVICGLQGSDVIDGGPGADKIFGGADADSLSGGDGNDLLIGGAGGDLLWAENGNDRLQGGDGNDRLYGHGGTDRLAGGNGHDELWGGSHDDLLLGQLGADQLYGDGGNDVLRGGAWQDRLDGGAGPNDGCTLNDPGGLLDIRINCEGGVYGR